MNQLIQKWGLMNRGPNLNRFHDSCRWYTRYTSHRPSHPFLTKPGHQVFLAVAEQQLLAMGHFSERFFWLFEDLPSWRFVSKRSVLTHLIIYPIFHHIPHIFPMKSGEPQTELGIEFPNHRIVIHCWSSHLVESC